MILVKMRHDWFCFLKKNVKKKKKEEKKRLLSVAILLRHLGGIDF